MYQTIIILVLMLVGTIANAETTYAISDTLIVKSHATKELEEITVTATPFPRKIGALPGNITYIPANKLKNSQQIDIKPVLDQVPGLYMQSGALNTARLTIRGIGSRTPYASNRIKAWFGEIPLTSGDGATIVEDLDMGGMGRIEVIKGPSSALYGSGLGGVIVISPPAIENGWQGKALAESGSFNLWRKGARISYGSNHQSFSTLFSRTTSDGFRENSRYERSNLLITGNKKLGIHSIQLLLNHIDLFARIPSSIDYPTYQSRPQSAAANWKNIQGFQSYEKWQTGLTFITQFNPNFENKLSLYGIYHDAYESRPFNILKEETKTIGFRENMQWRRNKHALSAGVEYFREVYNWQIFETIQGNAGNQLTDAEEFRHFYNIFVHFESELSPSTLLLAGINFHELRYRNKEADEHTQKHTYSPVFSPRIGINQRITPNTYLYATAGHGFSAPASEEALLPDGTINRELKPEEGFNVEAGIRKTLLNDHLLLDLTTYSIWVKNLLMTRRDAEDVFYGENAGRTNHSGLETQLKWYLIKSTPLNQNQLLLSASYTLMENRFSHFIENETNYSDKNLPGLPSSLLNLNISVSTAIGLGFNVNLSQINKQYLNDANSLTYPGHELVDITATYTRKLKLINELQIISGVRNLFNRDHASMLLVNAQSFGNALPRYYYPGNPRNWLIGIRITI